MRIGVDVGGTNTDAVLMDGSRVLAATKQPTTEDVSSGIIAAIRTILDQSRVNTDAIDVVMIGTTHFTNAFVEAKRLLNVGVVRLSLPSGTGIPPLCDWPDRLKKAVGEHVYQVGGGYQFDGRLNAPLDEKAIIEAARDMKAKGIKSAAVSGIFAQVNSEQEERAAEILKNEVPGIAVTLSHNIGRLGLLERENAAIMNASLSELASAVVNSFRKALVDLNIDAPFFVSQNDGTLMSAEYVEKYPVLTFASGPTNSMRGAAYLSGAKNAIVADIGGTTTDFGVLSNGFPRESSVTVDIGGVRTNFRMPDVLAMGLGGGSLVQDGDPLKIGPESVGYRLTEKSIVFGGETLTTSDIAVAAGQVEMGDPERVKSLDSDLVNRSLEEIHRMISEGVDRMKSSVSNVPLILVGGGAVLVSRSIKGTSEVIVPDNAGVANAIGAAIAQVGGEVDRVFSYEELGREGALTEAKAEAITQAVKAGAVPESVEIMDVEEVPLQYVPGGAVRLRVRAVGDLALSSSATKA